MIGMLETSVQIGFLYVPLALGLYLAMGVLSLPDLTVQGTFGVGGAATAQLLSGGGMNPLLALGVSMLAGALIGSVTALLHLRLHLNVLIAGIVVMTACFSIALVIMGSGNLTILGDSTVVSWFMDAGMSNQTATIVMGTAAVIVIGGGLVWFLGTEYGLSLRASGQNIQTARGLGIRTESRQVVGLMIANAFAACSGSLLVQSQGFMDVAIPEGVIVIGLAALIIGESLIKTAKVGLTVCGVIIGIVCYQLIVSIALEIGLDPNLLKLATAGIVIVIIGIRMNGHLLMALPGTNGAKQARVEQLRFYEEDKVASFI